MNSFREIARDMVFIIILSSVVAAGINLFHPRGFILVGKSEYGRKQVVDISVEEAKVKYDSDISVFIDTRDSQLFRHERIKGAVSVPALPESVRAAAFEKHFQLLSQGKEVVLYCSGSGCGDSSMVADALMAMDYSRVIYIIKKGIPGWKDAGHPVSEGRNK